jgi:hypothetical protein
MVRNVLMNCIERFCLTRSLSTILGFGRKMYTDYEIVCKVRDPSDYHRYQAINLA